MTTNKTYNKQFVISNCPIPKIEDWKTIDCFGDWKIHYCPNLQVKTSFALDKSNWILIGNSIETRNSVTETPPAQISRLSYEGILDSMNYWSGRWIAIGDGRIFMDGTGLLGLFYSIQEPNYISSSFSLMCQLMGTSLPAASRKKNDYINWILAPSTGEVSIIRLLQNQFISINEVGLKVHFRKPIETSLRKDSELIEIIKSRLLQEVKNIELFNTNHKIKLALTSGYDSRLILSLLLHQKIEFTAYTQEHAFMAKSDREIPKLMAKKFGFKHSFIKMNAWNENKSKEFLFHTGNQSHTADWFFYARNQWQTIESNSILLRGGLFGSMKIPTFYDKYLASPETLVCDIKNFQLNPGFSHLNPEFRVWIDTIDAEMFPEFYTFRSLFHVQQRNGVWLSDIEQANDLLPVQSLNLGNSREMINLMIALSHVCKKNKCAMISIFKDLTPELSDIPFNQSNPFYYKAYLKTKRLLTPAHRI